MASQAYVCADAVGVWWQLDCIPEAPLANMAFQILWAMAYLKHEKRVHRDIKPSNLLINRYTTHRAHL